MEPIIRGSASPRVMSFSPIDRSIDTDPSLLDPAAFPPSWDWCHWTTEATISIEEDGMGEAIHTPWQQDVPMTDSNDASATTAAVADIVMECDLNNEQRNMMHILDGENQSESTIQQHQQQQANSTTTTMDISSNCTLSLRKLTQAKKRSRTQPTSTDGSALKVAVPAGYAVISLNPSAPIPACVNCHRRKVSCMRSAPAKTTSQNPSASEAHVPLPCIRCIRAGQTCEQREEKTQAGVSRPKKRRKEKAIEADANQQLLLIRSAAVLVPTLASTPSHSSLPSLDRTPSQSSSLSSGSCSAASSAVTPVSNPLPAPPVRACSAYRWSQQYLASLQRHGVIEAWKQADAAFVDVLDAHRSGAARVGFATRMVLAQCGAHLMHHMAVTADGLVDAHFQEFISPLRHTVHRPGSLLTHWANPQKRPFFKAYVGGDSDTLGKQALLAPHPQGAQAGVESGCAEYRCELLPSSAAALLEWTTHAMDVQLPTIGDANSQAFKSSLALLADPAVRSLFESFDCFSFPETTIANATATIEAAAALQPSRLKEAEDTGRMNAPLSRPAALKGFHASWCATRVVAAHTPSDGGDCASTTICTCESLPLVIRVGVNSEYTSLFGWDTDDVARGFQTEGHMWIRRMHDENEWPELLNLIGSRLTTAVTGIRGFLKGVSLGIDREPKLPLPLSLGIVPSALPSSSASPSSAKPSPPRRAYSRFILINTRWGTGIPCSVTKWVWNAPMRFQFVMQWRPIAPEKERSIPNERELDP